jgi:hypothetical protein
MVSQLLPLDLRVPFGSFSAKELEFDRTTLSSGPVKEAIRRLGIKTDTLTNLLVEEAPADSKTAAMGYTPQVDAELVRLARRMLSEIDLGY